MRVDWDDTGYAGLDGWVVRSGGVRLHEPSTYVGVGFITATVTDRPLTAIVTGRPLLVTATGRPLTVRVRKGG